MKNNKIFSKKLFFDGISQTRVVGIILIAVSLIASITRQNSLIAHDEGLFPWSNVYNSKLCVYIYAFFVPILMIWLFKAYFKRSSSDFFDSVGIPKITIAMSYTFSAVFWSTIMVLILSGFDVYRSVIYEQFSYQWSYILMCFVYSFVGILQTAAIWLTAVAITGKLSSCAILAIILTYLPQFVINVMFSFPAQSNRIFWVSQSDNIMAHELNIAAKPMFYLTSYYYAASPKMSQIIYSFILFAIYLSLGLFLFSKRPSETSGHTSCNKWVSAVIPAAVAIFIAVVGLNIKVTLLSGKLGSYAWIFFIAAAVAYFVLYLIIERKSIRLKPMIAGLLIFCLGGGIIFGTTFGSYDKLLNTKLSVDEIKSVNWFNYKYNENYMGQNSYGRGYFEFRNFNAHDMDNYFDCKISEYDITGDKIKTYFSDFSKLYSYEKKTADDGNYEESDFSDDKFFFKVNTEKKSYYLQTNNVECMEYVKEQMFNDSGIRKIFTELPNPNKIELKLNTARHEDRGVEFSQKQLMSLYESLNDEIKTVDYREWFLTLNFYNSNIFNGMKFGIKNDPIANLNVDVYINGERKELVAPISNLTPKTLNKFFEYLNVNQKKAMGNILENAASIQEVERCNITGSTSLSYLLRNEKDTDIQKILIDYFKSVKSDPIIGEYNEFFEVEIEDSDGKFYVLFLAADFDKMSNEVAAVLNGIEGFSN